MLTFDKKTAKAFNKIGGNSKLFNEPYADKTAAHQAAHLYRLLRSVLCRPCSGSSSSWCSSTHASSPPSTTGSPSGWTISRYVVVVSLLVTVFSGAVGIQLAFYLAWGS